MNIIEVTSGGKKVAIPASKIKGVTEFDGAGIKGFSDQDKTFIFTNLVWHDNTGGLAYLADVVGDFS